MITISYRTIKIAAIFIAITLYAAMAIPAGSESISKSPGVPTLRRTDPKILTSPFQVPMPDATLRMEVTEIVALGLDEIEGQRYAWAYVFVADMEELNLTSDELLLYLPGPRLQSLFETAYATGSRVNFFAHPIERPEGILVGSYIKIYEVTSAVTFPPY